MTKTPSAPPGAPHENQRLLRLEEAARHLSLSVRAVQEFVADGSLTVVRFGRRIAFHPDDLRRFVEARRGGSRNPVAPGPRPA
jgi:excisionase family DNA binding protein